MKSDYETVKNAIHFIAENRERQPTLDEMAAHAGMSLHHFQRVFSRWAGVSPKRLLQFLTATEAGELLRRRVPILETSIDVGLSSSSRLHDLFVTVHGMSPAAYREHGSDLQIDWGVAMSDFGLALVAVTSQGICWMSFHDEDTLDQGVLQMRCEWQRSRLTRNDARIGRLVAGLFGAAAPAPVHVLVKGSNFQIRVWQALLSIPPGSIATYGDLSQAIERPGAGRAVGTAVGANPVSWLIPCHRVIRATGMIGGYRWGTTTKSMMLLKEVSAAEPARAAAS